MVRVGQARMVILSSDEVVQELIVNREYTYCIYSTY